MSREKKSYDKPNSWLIALYVSIVVLLWGGSWFIISRGLSTWQERAAFGDMFGVVNALFSGLAFAGVIIAIMLQLKELRLQREELEHTREELKGQKEQLERQANYLKEQIFENKFFHLLRLHNENIALLQIEYFDKCLDENGCRFVKYDLTGRNIFNRILIEINDYITQRGPVEKGDAQKLIDNACQSIFYERRLTVEYYLNFTLNLVKFVHNSHLDDKQFYIDTIKASYSSHELAILFYFAISQIGVEYRTYAVEYGLFKPLDLTLIVTSEFFELLPNEAFSNVNVPG